MAKWNLCQFITKWNLHINSIHHLQLFKKYYKGHVSKKHGIEM